MTQTPTPRGFARLIPALVIAPAFLAWPQHVAESEGARVTTFWRSERALDQYAREGLSIVDAVLAAAPDRSAAESEPGKVNLGIAESPLDLRWLVDPSLKPIDQKLRRKRRRAGLDEDDAGTDGPEQPLVVPSADFLAGGGGVVAVAPRIHDRVMFGTGLPPTTRWALALEASRAVGASGADLLGPALAGMQAASYSRGLEEEPFTSTSLRTLQRELMSAGEAEEVRATRMKELARMEFPGSRAFDSAAPTVASVGLVARHLVKGGVTAEEVLAMEPRWVMEAGAIGTHPFGWHVVATRKTDALALSAEALSGESFTLKSSFLVLSNDLKVPAQADIVLGDQNGHRYLIVCNSREGVYVFERAGSDAPYETVAEKKEVVIPVGRPVEISVLWRDHTLVITIGGYEMAGIVLPEDAMEGSYGFGAHAGSSVLFGALKFK